MKTKTKLGAADVQGLILSEDGARYQRAFCVSRPTMDGSAAFEALARHLEERDWTHFVTLTVTHQIGIDVLAHTFIRWVREKARMAGAPVPWFYAIEQGSTNRPHVHALLGGTGHLHVAQLQSRWRLGSFTRADIYEPAIGATRYLMKELVVQPDAWDVSWRDAPRRRRGR